MRSFLLAFGLLSIARMAAPTEAQAQTVDDAVSGSAKGIVGGAFLGAEVVMLPMGIAGLKPWWPYVVFGSVGAVGGAVGGWAVEQMDPPSEAPLYMLAGGLALIIPTLVVTLNATLNEDIEGAEESTTTIESDGPLPGETAPVDGAAPPAGPAPVQGSAGLQTRNSRPKRGRPLMPVSLFDWQRDAVRMGVPAIEVRQVYTQEQIAKFGLEQETEVRVPVFRAAF